MYNPSIRILLIESSEADAVDTQRLLGENRRFNSVCRHVTSLRDGLSAIASSSWDIILADSGIPGSLGIETISALRRAAPNTPVISLSGVEDPDFGLLVMRAGADDFLPKPGLTRCGLGNAVLHLIQRFRAANLTATNQMLEEKNRQLSAMCEQSQQFVDHVSHEFRTPLTVIREFASIVRDGIDGPVTEAQSSRLNVLIDRTDDLARMVDDLLDTSLLETGLVRSYRRKHSLGAIVKSVGTMLARNASKKNIALLIDHIPDDLAVFCDDEKLRRVLINLVNNAIKFTPEFGTIAISVDTSEESRISIRVKDNGPGIAKNELEKIFQRFHRSAAHKRMASQKGFGLGLNIARSLAKLNLGSIEAVSEEGKGSQFSVNVPRTDLRSILMCYFDQREAELQQGADCRICAFTVTAAQREQSQSDDTFEIVESFLQKNLASVNLVVPMMQNSWLVYCPVSASRASRVIDSLREQWCLNTQLQAQQGLPGLSFHEGEEFYLPDERNRLIENALNYSQSQTFHRASNSVDDAALGGQKVLVVEDETDLACAIAARLEAKGSIVKVVHDGRACLSAISEFDPSVILLDIKMPHLNGFEVLERIKRDHATDQIPVVVLSASTTEQQKAIDAGADLFVQKPFKSETLVSTLIALLYHRPAPPENRYDDRHSAFEITKEICVAHRRRPQMVSQLKTPTEFINGEEK